MKEGAVFIGQIYDVRTKRDGSGRIQIDFSMDALEDIQWAQKISLTKNCNFQVALVPLDRNNQYVVDSTSEGAEHEEALHESGEVIL
jgi:hypothetical protein